MSSTDQMHVADAPLKSRIKTAARTWGIETIADLRIAHESGRTKQWRGIGKGAIAELDRFFEPPKKVTKNERLRRAKKAVHKIVRAGEPDNIEQRARAICAEHDKRKVHRSYWNRPRESLGKHDIFALDCVIATLKTRVSVGPRRIITASDIERELQHEERRQSPLHERLEFQAMQLATRVGREYNPRCTLRALRLFELAEKVRDRRP